MSKTITLSVPDEVYEEMRSHPEINYSELARERIGEYLAMFKGREELAPHNFLLMKDLVFTPAKIEEIHRMLDKKSARTGNLLWVDAVFDLDMLDSLAKFMHSFPRAHPFEDANKRTMFVCVDAFLRLNRMRLAVRADAKKTTEDEKFFWQNANMRKEVAEIRAFIEKRIVPARKPKSVEDAVRQSIEENKALIRRLAAE
ncbi:MAG: Fic family protein [Candidatus Diapherotrites archaeon]